MEGEGFEVEFVGEEVSGEGANPSLGGEIGMPFDKPVLSQVEGLRVSGVRMPFNRPVLSEVQGLRANGGEGLDEGGLLFGGEGGEDAGGPRVEEVVKVAFVVVAVGEGLGAQGGFGVLAQLEEGFGREAGERG